MSILKIEAFSGLSGDMFLGALTDLTGAYDELAQLPSMLGLEKVEVKVADVEKAGIACKHIKILDHNSYEKGGSESSSQEHVHEQTHEYSYSHHHQGHAHSHAHSHVHHQHTQSHAPHRHLKDIIQIIDGGAISEQAKTIAKEIFQLLGQAEAKVHGIDLDKIHFHEVGAIDSIMDIVGVAYLLDKLNIDQSVSTPICTGHGFVMADHGRMPVPAPATKELLLDMPTYSGQEKGEMTTPTGAAILKYLAPTFDIPVLIEKKTGHGPGERDFQHPNVLRLTLCEFSAEAKEQIYMVETNIDDMSMELLGNDFQENLLKVGALDFYFTQVIMKKGRPGLLISVFSAADKLKEVTDYLLENTTTIGVRSYKTSRQVLKRNAKSIKTSLGEVRVKEVELPSGRKRITFEYESCKKIAKRENRPISEVFSILNKEL